MRTYSKTATTYQEQLDLLVARGLQVGDPKAALTMLERVNYYRLSAYWHPFKRADETFQADGSFEKAYEFYQFDRELRLTVMDMLERVEVGVRCAIAYHLAHAYDPWSHENHSIFDRTRFSPAKHATWLADLHRETDRSKEAFIEHFRATYSQYPSLPLWVAAEVMSFGTLSRLYFGLNSTDRTAIAKPHGVHQVVFASWLHCLAHVRNICAHHSRLWNRELSIAPKVPYTAHWQPPEIPDNKKVLAVLCILRSMSIREPSGEMWARQTAELMRRYDAEPRWLHAMGIPTGWKNHPFWSSVV